MRDLKFRVWTGLVMEYDIIVGKLGTFYCRCLDPQDSASLSPLNTILPKETHVMQYTGLKDKNCVEIYEGDIVFDGIALNLPITVDEFHGYRFMFGKGTLSKAIGVYGEVIGNIYSNPELLKA